MNFLSRVRNQKGEIATILTLISVGLMLAGLVVGNVAVQQTTRTQSKAGPGDDPTPNPTYLTPPPTTKDPDCKFDDYDACKNSGCKPDNCINCGSENNYKHKCTAPSKTASTPECKYADYDECTRSGCKPENCQSCGSENNYKFKCSATPSTPSPCTSCVGEKCIYHPEIDLRSGRADPGVTQCTDTGCVSDAECAPNKTCRTNSQSCGEKNQTCCDEGTKLRCNTKNVCEPIPFEQPKCEDFYDSDNSKAQAKCKDACGSRGCEQVPFAGGFVTNCWRCNTKEYCGAFGNEECAVGAGKPTPTLNPKASTTGGSQNCYPFECPNDKDKKFSVKNKQLFKGGECKSGNEVTSSYNDACNTIKYKDGCEFVGGVCKNADTNPANPPQQSQCLALKNSGGKYTGKGFDKWGPEGNQVNIALCSSGNVCCEPSTEPNGGFIPKALPVISQPPSSGQQGDCKINLPANITKDKSFDLDVTTSSSTYADAGDVELKRDGSSIQNKFSPPASSGKWNYKNISLSEGTHTFTFHVNCQAGGPCTQCGSNTITVIGSGSSSTSAAKPCNEEIAKVDNSCYTCVTRELPSDQKTAIDKETQCTNLKQNFAVTCKSKSDYLEKCTAAITTCSPTTKKECNLIDTSRLTMSLMSYDNTSFDKIVEAKKQNLITAIDASIYVLNATRVPGLQRLYCDPFKGQCDFYYQQQGGT